MTSTKSFFKQTFSLVLALIVVLMMNLSIETDTFGATDYNFCFPVNNGCKIAYYQGYTSEYGANHDGVDIHSKGDDTIYAAYSGVVDDVANKCDHVNYGAACEHYTTYGNYVRIKGDNGIYFYYGHLKQNTIIVKKGDRVEKGQAIATMGSSGYSTGKHLHFEIRQTTSSSTRLNANPKGTLNGLVTYQDGPYGTIDYESMPSGDILLKNKSTGTYMTVDGGKASNGQNISVSAKTSSDAFKFNISGGTSNYLYSKINTSYVVNPYSDNPGNGTNITLYTKDSTGTQTWKFEAVSGGYIIHSGYNESCVLTVDGTNVKLATKTGKDNQIWAIEGLETYTSMSSEDIWLKNKSTGSYMTVDGGKASNGQNISVASKTTSDAFKFTISGGTSNYLASKLNTSYVVNPYSDTPGNNTNITLYTKDSTGTQTWKFEAVSGGYIIHSGYNESCVLTVDGTNVKLATKTGKDNQIWVVEKVTNETTTTTTATTKTTTTTTATTTTTSAPELSIDISELTLFVGEQYNIKANQDNLTYKSSNTDIAIINKSGVITAVGKGNAVITVYNADGDAVQLKLTVTDHVKGDANDDNQFTIADAVMLQNWLLGSGELTNWHNADLCEDGIIDVFDMVEMRKHLTEISSLSAQ